MLMCQDHFVCFVYMSVHFHSTNYTLFSFLFERRKFKDHLYFLINNFLLLLIHYKPVLECKIATV